jgi:hypothetical protein
MPQAKRKMDLSAPKFDKGDNPKFFIEKFELVSKLNEWNEEEKCIQMCLCLPKEAEDWYLNLNSDVKSNYEGLKSKFLERFSIEVNRTQLYNTFLNLEQGSDNVNTYIEKVLTYGRKLQKSDGEIMDKILHGLHTDLKKIVILKEVDNLNDVIKFAKMAESMVEQTCEKVDSIETKQVEQHGRHLEKNRRPYHRNRTRGERRGEAEKKEKCRHCGRFNHESSECRFKNAKCFNCGKQGHIAKICRFR